jgi:hypothetical protein
MRAQNLRNGMICKNILHFLEELKNMENRLAWFLAELCKAKEGVQNQRNQLRTELVRGCLAPRQSHELDTEQHLE